MCVQYRTLGICRTDSMFFNKCVRADTFRLNIFAANSYQFWKLTKFRDKKQRQPIAGFLYQIHWCDNIFNLEYANIVT